MIFTVVTKYPKPIVRRRNGSCVEEKKFTPPSRCRRPAGLWWRYAGRRHAASAQLFRPSERCDCAAVRVGVGAAVGLVPERRHPTPRCNAPPAPSARCPPLPKDWRNVKALLYLCILELKTFDHFLRSAEWNRTADIYVQAGLINPKQCAHSPAQPSATYGKLDEARSRALWSS